MAGGRAGSPGAVGPLFTWVKPGKECLGYLILHTIESRLLRSLIYMGVGLSPPPMLLQLRVFLRILLGFFFKKGL